MPQVTEMPQHPFLGEDSSNQAAKRLLGTQPQLKCRIASSPTSSEHTPEKADVEHGVLRELVQLVLAVGNVRPDSNLETWQSVRG